MKPSLEELMQYVDGNLNEYRSRDVEKAIADDPAIAESVSALEASKLPFPQAYNLGQYPELPEQLHSQTTQMIQNADETKPHRTMNGWIGFGIASSLALATLLGFQIGQGSSADRIMITPTAVIKTESLGLWADQIANYQSLYVRETVEHVQNSGIIDNDLKSRLIAQENLHIRVPDLSETGYRFVRAQQLGYQGETLLQLVYLGDKGIPLAICYMPDPAGDMAMSQANLSGLNTVYWRQSDHRFVIVGDIEFSQLHELREVTEKYWL